jgi:two-component system response regulator VicR
MSRVLIVEDEKPIAEIVRFHLEREGFETAVAHGGREGIERFRSFDPDLVVLDLMLPELSGLEVCRELRRVSRVPILMLTAKDEEVDKVVGLEIGADDYVTKPFSMRELIARVHALLRRTRELKALEQQSVRPVRRFGRITLDLLGYTVERDGVRLDLTPREFMLLRHLAIHPGQVFSREALLEAVWGYEYSGDSRAVDVTVRRLREKVEDDPSHPVLIRTRRGVGYYLDGQAAEGLVEA